MIGSFIGIAGFPSNQSLIPSAVLMDNNEIWFSMVWEKTLLAQ